MVISQFCNTLYKHTCHHRIYPRNIRCFWVQTKQTYVTIQLILINNFPSQYYKGVDCGAGIKAENWKAFCPSSHACILPKSSQIYGNSKNSHFFLEDLWNFEKNQINMSLEDNSQRIKEAQGSMIYLTSLYRAKVNKWYRLVMVKPVSESAMDSFAPHSHLCH